MDARMRGDEVRDDGQMLELNSRLVDLGRRWHVVLSVGNHGEWVSDWRVEGLSRDVSRGRHWSCLGFGPGGVL